MERDYFFFLSVFLGIFYLLISLSDAVFQVLSNHMLVFFFSIFKNILVEILVHLFICYLQCKHQTEHANQKREESVSTEQNM